jgi:U3 small nucleolar RNA-associated protein 10
LIRQISVAASLDDPAAKDVISSCISSMAGIVLDEGLLKHINLDTLMQTREDEVRTKLYALGCAHRMWEDHGGRLAGLQTETLPLVHDCAEDTHDEVVREARWLKVLLDRF